MNKYTLSEHIYTNKRLMEYIRMKIAEKEIMRLQMLILISGEFMRYKTT